MKLSQQAAAISRPIALIDTRTEVPQETLGIVVSIHESMVAAFRGNEIFQARMRAGGEVNIRTKIVTLKEPLALGEQVHPAQLAGNRDPAP